MQAPPLKQTQDFSANINRPAKTETIKDHYRAHAIKYLYSLSGLLIVVIVALIIYNGSELKHIRHQLASLSQSGGVASGSNVGRLSAASSDAHFSHLPSSSSSEHDHDSQSSTETTDEPEVGVSSRGSGHSHNRDRPDDGSSSSGNDDEDAEHEPNLIHKQNNAFRQRGSRVNPAKIRESSEVCLTPGCVRAAAQILNFIDNTTEPCDDFYKFACGRWIDSQVISDDKTTASVYTQLASDLNVKIRALIERRPSADEPPIVGQMRNIYASCMNLTDIEARGEEPLLEVLRYLGGWPVLNEPSTSGPSFGSQERPTGASSTTSGRPEARSRRRSQRWAAQNTYANWQDIVIKLRQRGFSQDVIVDISVVPDIRDSRRYIIEIDQTYLTLPDRSYYFMSQNDTTVAAYLRLMTDSAVALGASPSEARRQMLEVFEFETQLASITASREQRRNITRLYNKMPARDLYKLAPSIDWRRLFEEIIRDKELDMDTDEVVVKSPSFVTKLDALMSKSEPRVVANYILWRVVRSSMTSLSRKWRELAHSYNSVTTGRQTEEPRWETCIGPLEGTLGTALSALYVKNHFDGRSKAAALEMVEYIRAELLRMLEEIDWMDAETREEAKLKAHAIATFIGYPDELLNDQLVEELYSGLQLERTNYYSNVRRLRLWSTDYAFSQLRKQNKRGDWRKHARAAVVNAYYNALDNSIEFPAGILQGNFFDAERPNYMNFGAIGYVIGHEITHGFDDRGRQYDRHGNDRNWWKPKTDARFRERAQCIIEQYGNYTVPENGLRVNGVNTQGENIADNGGIKEAYRAYERWTKEHGREPRLPGLKYSPEQMFWISAANVWCGKFRPEVLKLRVTSGVHSPSRFRVIGPFSNSPEFAQSFGCPLGSPMNPSKKCTVW